MRQASSATWISGLVRLVGDRVLVLQVPAQGGQSSASGRGDDDVDCAVVNLDQHWPLRLPMDSTLRQCLHYEARGWCWLVERDDGHAVAIDTLSDADGLGQEGFPTSLLSDMEHHPPSALRAAYLTAKRLRKGSTSPQEWATVQRLANEDPAAYRQVLSRTIGRRAAGLLYSPVLGGRLPDLAQLRRARRLQLLWRFRSPARVIVASLLGARRAFERVTQPTGLLVLLAGPDGSGKSTLADRLPQLCANMFTGQARCHWRPGLLPRPGSLVRRNEADPTAPHARPPHSRPFSCALLGYYWLDFLLGGWLSLWPSRLRTRLVVIERGWWDIAVDPKRYRLDVPGWLVHGLGTFLPRPDLALVLEADPQVLAQRKAELAEDEVARQMSAWKNALPSTVHRAHLDASRSSDVVADETRRRIQRLLETRTMSRLSAGWLTLPRRGPSRWLLPRGPRAAARAALAVYHPMTGRGRLGWEAARLWAASGALRLLPRGEGPPRPVVKALAGHLPPRSTIAVARMTHPGRGRYLALVVGEQGQLHAVAKVATDAEAAQALDEEADRIQAVGQLLPPPLSAPGILCREPGLLLLEAVDWRPRRSPWRLEEEVAHALGAFYSNGAQEGQQLLGPAHGDCAPWNLLQTQDGWVLIDWEDASAEQHPYFDLCHYLVQAHALLGRPSSRVLLEGFREGKGWVGRTVRAYADGAGVPAGQAEAALRSYLISSPARLRPRTSAERDGLTARRRLLASLGG